MSDWVTISQSSTSDIPGYFADTIASNAITPDLGNGFNHEVVLNQATAITINNPTYVGGIVQLGYRLVIVVVQDGTGGRPNPTWGGGYFGVSTFQITRDVNSRNTFAFIWTGSVWALSDDPLLGNL